MKSSLILLLQVAILSNYIIKSEQSFLFLSPWYQNLAKIEIEQSLPEIAENDKEQIESADFLEASLFPKGIFLHNDAMFLIKMYL